MPTDGSGNYSKPAGSTATTGTTIEASTHNTPIDDIASALSARLMANGSKVPTANLPMGGFIHTGLGAGTTNGHSVRYNEWSTLGTETGPGRIELATSAESITGTSQVLATHPAGVKALALSLIATASQIWTGTTNLFVSPEKLVDAGAFVTITDGANLSTNMNAGRNFVVTIAGNRAMDNPTNVKVGHVLTYAIIQGTGGSRTITWGTSFNFGDGTATLSTSEGDLDLVSFMPYSSTQLIFLGIRKAAQSA